MSQQQIDRHTQDHTHAQTITGNKEASLLGQAGWLSFEVAMGPYFLLVNIFVFGPYFAGTVIGDPVQGQASWGYIQAFAGAVIALSSPLLGALTDAWGPRKPGLILASCISTIGMFFLWFADPAQPHLVPLVALGIVIASVGLEVASVYHNAMLPNLAGEKTVGKLSGLGYAAQYLGGSTVFIIWLVWFSLPEVPAFGLSKELHQPDRIVGPMVALWLLPFLLPLLFFTPDRERSGLGLTSAAREGLATLWNTISELKHYQNIALYLLARLVYYDGLTAIFVFVGVYASGIFGWSTSQVGIFALIILNIAAITGFFGGMIDDRIGSKRTIMFAVAGFTLGNALGFSVSPEHVLFVIPIASLGMTELPIVGPFAAMLGFETVSEQLFLLFGIGGGIFAGPALASSRTMLARIAPPEMAGEFYGLYTLTGKATAFLAPLAVSIVTQITQNQRAGISIILVFLVTGLIMMFWVREERTEAAH